MKAKARNEMGDRYVMKKEGFTLVELMIVVSIIGMLSAVAIPSMRNARMQAQAMAVANDLRVFEGAFKQYSLDYKSYYPNVIFGPAPLPQEIADYLKTPDDWVRGPSFGGRYVWRPRWDPGLMGYSDQIWTVEIWDVDPQNEIQLMLVDKHLDDGVKGWSGKVVWWPGSLYSIIESQ